MTVTANVTEAYEGLIAEASPVFPIPAARLDEALLMLIETSGRSRRSAIGKFRYWFGPATAREPLERAREARWRQGLAEEPRYEVHEQRTLYELRALRELPPEYEIARQAMTFDIIPLETSPLTKTSLDKLATEGGTLAICFYTGGPTLVVVGTIGLIAIPSWVGFLGRRGAGGRGVWRGRNGDFSRCDTRKARRPTPQQVAPRTMERAGPGPKVARRRRTAWARDFESRQMRSGKPRLTSVP